MNARAFLRWAGVNLLLGSWDNYFATPVELLPLQLRAARRRARRCRGALLHVHPLGLRQQLRHRLLRHRVAVHRHASTGPATPSTTAGRTQPARGPGSRWCRTCSATATSAATTWTTWSTCSTPTFNPAVADRRRDRDGGLWDRVSQAAYLESDTPGGQPFTGRQFTNDEVYRSGREQQELRRGDAKTEGIIHYVRMRHDRARAQLAELRRDHPAGASGADFSGSSSRCRHHEQDRSERPAEGALADGAAPARPGTGGEDRLAAAGRGGRAPRGQRRPRRGRLLLRDLRQRAPTSAGSAPGSGGRPAATS